MLGRLLAAPAVSMATVHTLSRLRDNRALHLGHLWLAYLEKQMHRIDKVKINIRRSRFFFYNFYFGEALRRGFYKLKGTQFRENVFKRAC